MATATESSSASSDGPVLSVISKRIRALRKKYNRIVQMEEALASGKALNKEQEEVLKSKPVVTALIDELEKLRSPLAAAVTEEVQQQPPPPPPQQQSEEQKPKQSDRSGAAADQDELIEDLLRLVYFGSLFDVRSQAEFTAMMLTRSHERGCCLTYDYVTDDVVDLLSEKDLNLISVLGSLVTSRPVNEVISHKIALEACISHAKRWISGSDQPINPETAATYAGLKEKLKKIISLDFFTATPEMKAPVEVAAAVGQLHISEGSTVQSETAEGDIADPDNKEEQENSQSSESYTEHHPSGAPDEPAKTDEVNDTVPRDLPPVHSEQQDLGEADMGDQVHADSIPKDQQAVGGGRRSYPNGRGGGRGGGGRRPYPNGRGGGGRGNGGRGGGGGYANGGRGYYHDSNYQPRGYYNNRGGRGGGGGGRSGGNGGSMYNRQGGGSNGGHATAPS